MDPIDNSSPFLKDIEGFIWFRFDEKFELMSLEGSFEEITGYGKEDFLSKRIELTDLVLPADKHITEKKNSIKRISSDLSASLELEYRIQRKDGTIKWVREVLQWSSEEPYSDKKQIRGFIQDITDIKNEEEILKEKERAELGEFHNIIKNNLEIISLLLGLQGNKFTDKEVVDSFQKSQSRVASISLIHEELYRHRNKRSLNIAAYLEKLSYAVLSSHTSETRVIELKLDLEPIYLEPDIAVSLGIIVNELILNSLKHAFPSQETLPSQEKGKILISFHKIKNPELNKTSELNKSNKNSIDRNPEAEPEISDEQNRSIRPENKEKAEFILTVSDNGKGLSEDFDLWSAETLGLQIVTSLVDQIGGLIELKNDMGTKFTIRFYSHFESLNGEE